MSFAASAPSLPRTIGCPPVGTALASMPMPRSCSTSSDATSAMPTSCAEMDGCDTYSFSRATYSSCLPSILSRTAASAASTPPPPAPPVAAAAADDDEASVSARAKAKATAAFIMPVEAAPK